LQMETLLSQAGHGFSRAKYPMRYTALAAEVRFCLYATTYLRG
jgi:hypothetical protein